MRAVPREKALGIRGRFGKEKKRKKRGKKGDSLRLFAARGRRCRSSSSHLSPLLCSARAFSLLGEIITRHQAPGPDIHRSEKQRERESKSERERGTEREVEKSLTQCNRRRATPTTISCLLCSPLTTKSAVLSLKFHPPLLDLGL